MRIAEPREGREGDGKAAATRETGGRRREEKAKEREGREGKREGERGREKERGINVSQ